MKPDVNSAVKPAPPPSSEGVGVQYYQTELGRYDELLASAETLLPHWADLLNSLESLGREGLEQRRREVQRLLRENGVSYTVYEGPQGAQRPWQLDPVPLLISSDEWPGIEAGLQQRAQLLDLLLQDIYGEQRLLKQGVIPPELVLCHRGFLHPCVGQPRLGRHQLILHAVNLARGGDGRMWVVDDRTQAPSGAGYALENRTVMTRVLPSLFRDQHIRRLAGFFRGLRSGLADIASHHRDDPRVVVLTPGPYNETYFEQAYLASYLGYTLAQGDDLTVRDGRVWLKSLEGLRQVDVILRRVDDAWCDPLELRADSRLGVAGLLEAVRRGQVAVANPVGSSVLENPALLPFLPGLCRHLLGEDLRLSSVATWWCGQPREMDFVLNNLERLLIKQINRGLRSNTVFGGELSSDQRQELRAQIKAKPHLFVGQERTGFSTAPSLVEGRIIPRPAILRTFLAACGTDYQVMPGGLTRVAATEGALVVSNQAGGISKDTLVISDTPEEHVSLWLQPQPDQLIQPQSRALPSRSADNLFWVGRYLERAEGTGRVLRRMLRKQAEVQEFGEESSLVCLHCLLRALTHITSTYPGFVGKGAEARLKEPRKEIGSLLQDAAREGTLAATLQAFHRTATSVGDLWSEDAWRLVNAIEEEWQEAASLRQPSDNRMLFHLDQLILKLTAFNGLVAENLVRETGWVMLDIGRRLERALVSIAFWRATLVPRLETSPAQQMMETVLATCESLLTYRRRYRSFMHLPTVLELLLMDERHPRALAYQLEQIRVHLALLPHDNQSVRLSEDQRILLEAQTQLRLADSTKLAAGDEEQGIYPALDELLGLVAERLWNLSDQLSQTYFRHLQGADLQTTVLEEV